jgi:hypothetical protein
MLDLTPLLYSARGWQTESDQGRQRQKGKGSGFLFMARSSVFGFTAVISKGDTSMKSP